MNLCHKCGKATKGGCFNFKGVFICKACSVKSQVYLFDEFVIEDGEVRIVPPFSDVSEKDQRAFVIDYIYRIFNQKTNRALFSQLSQMIKRPNYTYLGIARAVEYHFVIKKQSIEKANGGIGIVPYVYEQAQTFYANESAGRMRKWITYLTNQNNEQKSIEVSVGQTPSRKKEMDMSEL